MVGTGRVMSQFAMQADLAPAATDGKLTSTSRTACRESLSTGISGFRMIVTSAWAGSSISNVPRP